MVTQHFEELEKEKKEKEFRKRKLEQLDKLSSGEAAKPKKQSSIKAAFSKQDCSKVDQLWGRAFFGNGIPFRFADDPYFKAAVAATASFGESYPGPPSADRLRNTILQREKQLCREGLASFQESLQLTGATAISDGWSDVRRRPLLNLLVVSPKGEMFLKAVTGGETKDAAYIAARLIAAIRDVGAENVIQVVTDSAAVCKAAGRLVEKEFPWITWTPCTPHCLDLLLEDMGKLSWAAEVVSEAKAVVKFITNHHRSQALFREKSAKDLLKPGDTRFATNFIMLDRMLEVKEALQGVVVGREWREWNEKSSHSDEGDEVRDCVLRSGFWKNVQEVLALTKGTVALLRECDRGVPIVGKVYVAMFNCEQELEALRDGTSEYCPGIKVSAQKYAQVHAIWEKRCEMLHSDMHAAGFVLDPEYQSPENGQHSNAEVMRGFHNIIEKLLPDVEDQVNAIEQLAKYRKLEGEFGRAFVKASAKKLLGWKWWVEWGSECPELQKVAQKVLSQVSCASACERNWSSYDFIHNKKRNRLRPDRANDLVEVFSNLRLMSKVNSVEYEEEMVAWDSEEEELEEE